MQNLFTGLRHIPETLAQDFDKAYDDLRCLTLRAQNAALRVRAAQKALHEERAQILSQAEANTLEDNETMREATLHLQTSELVADLHAAEEHERDIQDFLRRATIDMEALRVQLRLMETVVAVGYRKNSCPINL